MAAGEAESWCQASPTRSRPDGITPGASLSWCLRLAVLVGFAHALGACGRLGYAADVQALPDASDDSGYSFAHPLQVDLASIFTADTVANTAPMGERYPPLVSMDGSGYDLLTESVAAAAHDPGTGLPDNGFFASDADHPDVQLAFDNTSVARNSVILNTSLGAMALTFPIPSGPFSRVQLYLTSTEGVSNAQATLHYDDGSTSVTHFTVPDWASGPAPSGPVFVVRSGLHRWSAAGGVSMVDVLTLYGAGLIANPTRTLSSVAVSVPAGTARLVLYGATAY